MRKYLRVTLIAAVLVTLGAVGALVGRNLWRQHQKEILQQTLEMLPGVSQHIRDFRQVKMKDGRKVWEVAATDARYFDDSDSIVVRGPVLSWYLEDGRRVGLEGDEGRIRLDKGNVAHVELDGNIQVFLADYQVRADRALYDHTTDLITVPGVVEITGRALEVRGRDMEVSIDNQHLSLRENVSTVMHPAQLRQKTPNDPS
jgi:LPS export ABC transporter protein LptC